MKNFDSVPQLQCFSYVHHCAARSCHGSHARQCHHSLLQRQLAALLQCGSAGGGFGVLDQQLQDQSPEPLVWTVEGVLNEQWIQSNWIESTRLVCGTESNRIVFVFAESPITIGYWSSLPDCNQSWYYQGSSFRAVSWLRPLCYQKLYIIIM